MILHRNLILFYFVQGVDIIYVSTVLIFCNIVLKLFSDFLIIENY